MVKEQEQTLLYTASSDRLIKLWHIDYFLKKVKLPQSLKLLKTTLLANLDEHADWVNHIILDRER